MPMRAVGNAFQEAWQSRWPFLLSHLVFGLLTVAVLAPLTSLALRAAIALSGKPALSDFDIALFLLSPVGFVSTLFVATLVVTTAVLDVAFMMAIALHARRTGKRQFEEGISTILPHLSSILAFTGRLLVRVLGIVAPFLFAGLLVFRALLTDYDINYYLNEHPPEFVRAVAIIGVIIAIMAFLLLRALLSWAVALPLVLFDGVRPRDSFSRSKSLMQGKRRDLLLSILAWAAISVVVISLLFGAVHLVVGFVVSMMGTSLPAIAAVLLISGGIGFLLNLFLTATTTGALACLLMERAGWPSTSGADAVTTGHRRKLRTALIAGLALGAIAVTFAGFDLSSYKVNDDVQVIAHRGAAGQRPENTMASFQKAIEDRADWIELDVQESADGVVIVVHDSDFMKLAGTQLKVWDATAEELADIDIGSWFSPEYSDQRTPTLRQVLELARGTGSGVLIELKYYGHDRKLEERVAALVEETGMVDQVQLMSLKYEAVKKMKALRPEWTVGLLAAASVGRLWDLESDFLAVNMGMANGTLVARSREVGKKLHVWTVNDPLDMSRMLSLGVSGLITDEPARAREVIAQRAELSTAQRLVLALGSQLGVDTSQREYRDGSP